MAAAALLAVLASCSLSVSGSDATATSGSKSKGKGSPAPTVTGAAGSALKALAKIDVKGRAPMTGYSREQFGPAWADTDRNGCDQRNDVLRRDLAKATFRAGTHGCIVLTGTLYDRYTGTTIHFAKAAASKVQIDHVVALGDAWATGADKWTKTKREELATDPFNLLAVDGSENESKGDGDAATWLPAKAYRCEYVARQVAVKLKYGAWMTKAEHAAIGKILQGCPKQKLPADEKIAPLGKSDGESIGDTGNQ
jgi:hypothetical protein